MDAQKEDKPQDENRQRTLLQLPCLPKLGPRRRFRKTLKAVIAVSRLEIGAVCVTVDAIIGKLEEDPMRNYEADILNDFLGLFFIGCAALSVIAAALGIWMAMTGY